MRFVTERGEGIEKYKRRGRKEGSAGSEALKDFLEEPSLADGRVGSVGQGREDHGVFQLLHDLNKFHILERLDLVEEHASHDSDSLGDRAGRALWAWHSNTSSNGAGVRMSNRLSELPRIAVSLRATWVTFKLTGRRRSCKPDINLPTNGFQMLVLCLLICRKLHASVW